MQESLKLDMRKKDFRRLTAAWVVAAICAAAVVMPAPVQAQQSGGWRQEVAEKAQAAQQAGQNGNYSEAIRLLKEAKSRGSLQPAEEQGVNELLIWAASGARDYGLLAATIEERLATGRVRGADQVNKLRTLADAYYSARDLRRASDATTRLIKARGTATPDDLILLGQLQFQLKDFRAAAPTLEKAYQAAGQWPSKDQIVKALEGIEVESLSGRRSYRDDHVMMCNFFQGITTHKNDFDFVTIDPVEVLPTTRIMKPSAGAKLYDWINATFPLKG